ncbi:hypothetical protein [Streptococcus pantholopis]|uniref:Uncharacterized protein n=1 Tax=Streptococcus pantholopis TaxID=1811193 RepID=A0A172Q8T6_9STRE|nr:hypothetical protein [Streptococcus pantholopis]AND79899.1 hypothetical protein A0O21_07715 [Streptococcus pantholopis]
MRMLIVLLAAVLFFAEWFVIRYTGINKWLPLLGSCLFALPLSLFLGVHLVYLPLLMMFLALAGCELEDWLKRYLRQKKLSELQRSELKDL